jgi:hypothetical protein
MIVIVFCWVPDAALAVVPELQGNVLVHPLFSGDAMGKPIFFF